MNDQVKAQGGARRLASGYQYALAAADVLFGGFIVLMVVFAAAQWVQGRAPFGDLVVLSTYLALNIVLGEISRRIDRPLEVETLRLLVAGAASVGVYVLVQGPLAPFWPVFLIHSMATALAAGLLTQKPHFGRAVVVWYVALFVVATVLRPGAADFWTVAVQVALAATVGFMFAEIMALLGRTLQAEHERGVELQAARDALFAEMEVAQEIQTLLLPKDPQLAEHEVVGRMVTANEVGGDYYDVIDGQDGRSLLAIGDVSGHGVTSGLTMMMARTSLVGAFESRPDATLCELYRSLNRCMRKNLERMGLSMYMTFALLEHEGGGRFRAVGRHLPILIWRSATDTVEELQLEGMWLGVLDDLGPELLGEREFRLESGDLLFLYTDGIVERFGDGGMFGFERLKDVVRSHAPGGAAQVVEGVLSELALFSADQDDDVTMLVVNNSGKLAHRPAIA